jgi:hypothetical protein
LRSQVITGMAAVGAVLGAFGAGPAAHAAPAKVESVPSVSAHSALPGIARILAGAHSAVGTGAATPASSAASSVVFGALYGVACKHRHDCLAVGQDGTAASADLWRGNLWGGGSWKATGLDLPEGATGGALLDASNAPGVLMAVGEYVKGSTAYPLDNIWTRHGWSEGPEQPAIPPGEEFAGFESVSCASSTFCVAVGIDVPASNTSEEIPLVEVWNGSVWRSSQPVVPASAPVANLGAVSCPTTSYCVVSGFYETSTGGHAWADSFDGAHWKVLSIPQPQGSASGTWLDQVRGVSCSSTTSCALVGTEFQLNSAGTVTSNSGFAETLANGTWTVATVPPSGTNSELNGVDCTSSTFCVATGGVGSYNTPVEGEGDVVLWNGAAWTPTLINPGTNMGSELVGIDCTSTSYCVAVGTQGSYDTETGQATSAFYNGVNWTQHTAP